MVQHKITASKEIRKNDNGTEASSPVVLSDFSIYPEFKP
jgi:hypothetical protein